jgi:hypothetical protein
MSTIAIAITVTYTGKTASTLPTLPPQTGTRTIAATDKYITDLAEDVRRRVKDQFQGIDPNSNANTTVAVTVT